MPNSRRSIVHVGVSRSSIAISNRRIDVENCWRTPQRTRSSSWNGRWSLSGRRCCMHAFGRMFRASVALVLRAFRQTMHQYPNRPEAGEDLVSLLTTAIQDEYSRTNKSSRNYPRKKREQPPAAPKLLIATPTQVAAAQALRRQRTKKVNGVEWHCWRVTESLDHGSHRWTRIKRATTILLDPCQSVKSVVLRKQSDVGQDVPDEIHQSPAFHHLIHLPWHPAKMNGFLNSSEPRYSLTRYRADGTTV